MGGRSGALSDGGDLERQIMYEYIHPHQDVGRGSRCGWELIDVCGGLDWRIVYGHTHAQDLGLVCRSVYGVDLTTLRSLFVIRCLGIHLNYPLVLGLHLNGPLAFGV